VSKKKIGTYMYETDGELDLLNPDLTVKLLLIKVKQETAHGTSDAIFELVLYDRAGANTILNNEKLKGDWRKTGRPSVLLTHNGA
jgi:hypothetical protein